jgi:hypothetical protein
MAKIIESSLMLLGAAGLGVGLMYVLDPEHGQRRREALAGKAHNALSSTGEAVGSTIHGASDSARSFAKKVSGYAHHLADHLHEEAHDAMASGEHAAREYVSRAQKRASEIPHGLMDRAGSFMSRHHKEPERSAVTLATEITAATVGLIGLGAGLMYVLDPAKGRARRAWMRDKAVSVTRQTGREARHYGRHLGNRMKGYAAKARRSGPWRDDQTSMPQSAASQPQ